MTTKKIDWREITPGVYENRKDKGTIVGFYKKQFVSLDKPSWLKELKRRGKIR